MPPAKRNAALDAILDDAPASAKEDAVAAPVPAPVNPPKPASKYAKVMLYTHPKVARKLKEIAFVEHLKANDVLLEAIDLYFAKAGHGGIKHVIEQ